MYSFQNKRYLKRDSLTKYKISKFFNPKMQGHTHTHTHLHVHACTHRNTQVHVDMSTVHFLIKDTTQLTLLMKLNSQTICHQTKMTWKTFEETRPKQVYQSLTCEGWWWWWPSDMKSYTSLVHYKYPSVTDYLCTNLTRHGTSFSKALKHFIYVQTILFAINQAVSCKPLSRKAQIHSQASLYGNCDGQSGSGIGFFFKYFPVFHYQLMQPMPHTHSFIDTNATQSQQLIAPLNDI